MYNIDEILQQVQNNDPTLQTLVLNGKLGSDVVKAFSEALKFNTVITQIDLCNVDIAEGKTRKEGIIALAETLKINSNIKWLRLHNNGIDDVVAQSLADALKVNVGIQFLDIGHNTIGDLGAQAFAEAIKPNSTLQTFHINSNKIGDRGVQALAVALGESSVREFNISSNYDAKDISTLTQNIVEAAKINPAFQSVTITDASTEEAIVLITETKISSIHLPYNHINSDGFERLAETLQNNTTVKELDLSHNWIGPADLSSGMQAFARMLEVNTTLESLNISYCSNLYAPEIIRFAQSLQVNKHIKTFCFSRYGSTTTVQQLSIRTEVTNMLSSNNTLVRLYIGHMDNSDIKHYQDALAHNYSLLELSFTMDPIIKSYLERNNTIKNCIDFLFQSDFSLDSDEIMQNILKLEELIPELTEENSSLGETNYFVECHRVLQGFFYGSIGQESEAWHIFKKPLIDTKLQMLTNQALFTILLGTGAFIKATADGKIARYQWIAYNSRHDRSSIEFKTALAGLKEDNPQMGTINSGYLELIGAEQLLDYDEILAIVEQASQYLTNERSPEKQLLMELLKSNYNETNVEYIWKSPTFMQILRQKYPAQSTFRLLENYLLQPIAPENSQAILYKIEDAVDITEDILNQFQLSNSDRQRQNITSDFETMLQQCEDTVYKTLQADSVKVAPFFTSDEEIKGRKFKPLEQFTNRHKRYAEKIQARFSRVDQAIKRFPLKKDNVDYLRENDYLLDTEFCHSLDLHEVKAPYLFNLIVSYARISQIGRSDMRHSHIKYGFNEVAATLLIIADLIQLDSSEMQEEIENLRDENYPPFLLSNAFDCLDLLKNNSLDAAQCADVAEDHARFLWDTYSAIQKQKPGESTAVIVGEAFGKLLIPAFMNRLIPESTATAGLIDPTMNQEFDKSRNERNEVQDLEIEYSKILMQTETLVEKLGWHRFWLYIPSFFSHYSFDKYRHIEQMRHHLNNILNDTQMTNKVKVTEIGNYLESTFSNQNTKQLFDVISNESHSFWRSDAEKLIAELGEKLDTKSLKPNQ